MIKYVASKCVGTISKVEVLRETKCFVFFQGGGREAKQSDWHNYFNTFDEAKQCLIDYEKDKIEKLKDEIKYISGKIEEIYKLENIKND